MPTSGPDSFEQAYSQLLEGADALQGGDSQDARNGGAHEFIDFDVRPEGPHPLYATAEATAMRGNGVDGNQEHAAQLIRAFNLLDMEAEVNAQAANLPEHRRGVISRTARAAGLVIKDAYQQATGTGEQVRFEELREAVTGKAPKVSDIREARAMLKDMLAKAGYTDVTDENLLYTVQRWRGEKRNQMRSPAETTRRVSRTSERVMEHTHDQILSRVSFNAGEEVGEHLEGADFGQLENVVGDLKNYSAFSLFAPQEGKPLRGVFALNNTHPNRNTSVDHVLAHEGFPGHHLQNVVMHLLRQNGQLGYEASMGTMGTNFHVLQEGWAQVVWEILANGGISEVAEKFGADLAVELCLVWLQDHAKHDAGILRQLEGMPIDKLQELFTTKYALDPHVVKKMTGGWAKSRTFSGLVGATYLEGRQGMYDMRDKLGGWNNLLPTVLHTEGFADMQFAQEQVTAKTMEVA